MSAKQHPYILRLAWYDEAQWQLLCTLVPDRNELDDTYEEWQRSARLTVRTIESGGQKVERVFVNALTMPEWLHARKLPLTSATRAEPLVSHVDKRNIPWRSQALDDGTGHGTRRSDPAVSCLIPSFATPIWFD